MHSIVLDMIGFDIIPFMDWLARNQTISGCVSASLMDLIVLDMNVLDIILCMEWIAKRTSDERLCFCIFLCI